MAAPRQAAAAVEEELEEEETALVTGAVARKRKQLGRKRAVASSSKDLRDKLLRGTLATNSGLSSSSSSSRSNNNNKHNINSSDNVSNGDGTAGEKKRRKVGQDGDLPESNGEGEARRQPDKSLFEVALELKENPEFEAERRKAEEEKFLAAVKAQQRALTSAKENAKGGQKYTKSLETGWRPVRRIRRLPESRNAKVRKKWHILVEGEDVPPPIQSFREMRLPRAIIKGLEEKGIKRPTPIQVQGLPVALSGRDMIGVAFTGSGKTITFTIPMVLLALGEEMKLPIVGGEGPFGVILGPSRELQSQTFQVVQHFVDALRKYGNHPPLYCTLAIGGQDKRLQIGDHEQRGTHMVVATPGRLNDFLKRRQLNLDLCRYVCLDEGDRMMDTGFEEEMQEMLEYCKLQRQTLLFSATMPKKFVDFAQSSLVRPVTVNVGRAGAANLDVVQEVEFVKQEAKIVHLLQCLQKSPPPVVIFCESKKDCDDVHEYLLLKGVAAVAIHGGKDQADRLQAIAQFKSLEKDVLVATDVAAKGLDFPDIQHVINFDMPSEIENYVHRIGRTGRGGKTGVATTFINSSVDPSLLLDLKHLLVEAKQRVPPMLLATGDGSLAAPGDDTTDTDVSCSYCGGLGHRITACPRLQSTLRAQQASSRDVIGSAAYGGNY